MSEQTFKTAHQALSSNGASNCASGVGFEKCERFDSAFSTAKCEQFYETAHQVQFHAPSSNAVIIGAGASGVFCAANLPKDFDVTIFEAQSAPLKKLLLTGGGRCNFTNTNIDTKEPKNFYPRGANNLRKVLKRFSAKDAIDFFEQHGVKTKIEDEGRAFPKSDKSQDIADALLKNTRDKIRLNCPISEIEKSGNKFILKIANGETMAFDAVIFAIGGHWQNSLKTSVEKLGHNFLPEIPSLFALKIGNRDTFCESGITLKNVALQSNFDGKKIKTDGALLTTHFGITGPAVLKFSSFAAEELAKNNFRCTLFANFLPEENRETIAQTLKSARQKEPKKMVKNFCPFLLPISFWQFLLKSAGLADNITYANLSKDSENKIINVATEYKLDVNGKSPSKSEFVTCGGIDCKDVDFSTMQSRKVENLFFLGECLNIDAITGGYNLHAAWATAHTCACHIAERVKNC